LVLPPAADGVDRDDTALGQVGREPLEDVGVDGTSVTSLRAEIPVCGVTPRVRLLLILVERLLD